MCLSSELADVPKRLKILCEDLVAYRDKSGRVGVLGAHCCHRGTSLEYGRIEENGIRCCYHGWLYDAFGRCLDQPGEPDESRYKDEVRQPWYPAEEYKGLVFVYMGPLDSKPLLPHYDILEDEDAEYLAYRKLQPRRGGGVQLAATPGERRRSGPYLHPARLESGPVRVRRRHGGATPL